MFLTAAPREMEVLNGLAPLDPKLAHRILILIAKSADHTIGCHIYAGIPATKVSVIGCDRPSPEVRHDIGPQTHIFRGLDVFQ